MESNPYKAMAGVKLSDNYNINTNDNEYVYVTKSELQDHENMVRLIIIIIIIQIFPLIFLEYLNFPAKKIFFYFAWNSILAYRFSKFI